jgi:hypothetical protein
MFAFFVARSYLILAALERCVMVLQGEESSGGVAVFTGVLMQMGRQDAFGELTTFVLGAAVVAVLVWVSVRAYRQFVGETLLAQAQAGFIDALLVISLIAAIVMVSLFFFLIAFRMLTG